MIHVTYRDLTIEPEKNGFHRDRPTAGTQLMEPMVYRSDSGGPDLYVKRIHATGMQEDMMIVALTERELSEDDDKQIIGDAIIWMVNIRRNNLEPFIRALRAWQPDAQNVIDVSPCHCERKGAMLFFQLPEFEIGADENGVLQGGYWCVLCQWSNAGSFEAKEGENEK